MIVLTMTESSVELISGSPEYVAFSSSEPASIYYTLDGSAPTEESLIAVGRVYLPSGGVAFSIKAVAISASDSSAVLEQEYSPDSTDLNGPRHIGEEGVLVMPYGEDAVDSLSYDAGGDPAQEAAKSFDDLDIKVSRVNRGGVMLDKYKTSVSFVNFAEISSKAKETITSTPNNNVDFDPTARVIVIDGSTDEKKQEQVVKIVNRPYNNLDPVSKFYDEQIGNSEQVITGNYVRSFYNPSTGIYTSFYWESRESRWLKSIQRIEHKPLAVSFSSEKMFVYRWIQDRAMSQIF
jgi:hypothetical protein